MLAFFCEFRSKWKVSMPFVVKRMTVWLLDWWCLGWFDVVEDLTICQLPVVMGCSTISFGNYSFFCVWWAFSLGSVDLWINIKCIYTTVGQLTPSGTIGIGSSHAVSEGGIILVAWCFWLTSWTVMATRAMCPAVLGGVPLGEAGIIWRFLAFLGTDNSGEMLW